MPGSASVLRIRQGHGKLKVPENKMLFNYFTISGEFTNGTVFNT